jgi:hypothetical protein
MKAAFLLMLLIVLAPGMALAHGGGSHEDEAPLVSGGAGRASVEADAWPPVCPPGSGHGCRCGDSSLCDDCPSPAALHQGVAGFFPYRDFSPVPGAETSAHRSPRFAAGRPRGPPLLS